MTDATDEQLALRAATGDKQAFEALVARHGDPLCAWIRLRGGTGSARESSVDVVQSVFLRVHDDLAGFEPQGAGSFRNWLHAYAERVLLNHRRAAKAAKRDPDREEYASLSRIYQSVCTPSRAMEAREEVESFERAFASLDEADRDIILLHKIEGLSHAEIAERTGRAEPACRKALSRALVRLAAQLG